LKSYYDFYHYWLRKIKRLNVLFKLKSLFRSREERRLPRIGHRLISFHAGAHATKGEVVKVYHAGYENTVIVYDVNEGEVKNKRVLDAESLVKITKTLFIAMAKG